MKEMTPLIEQVLEIVKGTKGFAIAQAPDFIRQFILLSYTENILSLVFFLLLLAANVKGAFLLKNNWRDLCAEEQFFGSFLAGAFGIFSIVMISSNLADLLALWLAPKVYIVTNISKILKGN